MQIAITNQKTKSMRTASCEAATGSQVGTSATAAATAPAISPIPKSAKMEPLRIQAEPRRKRRRPNLEVALVRFPREPSQQKEECMGLGVGLILSAIGAVLAFAVDTTVSG